MSQCPSTSPADLDVSLHAGVPPVYAELRGIVLEDIKMTISIVLEAIEMTGVRAIIAEGRVVCKEKGVPMSIILKTVPMSRVSSM